MNTPLILPTAREERLSSPITPKSRAAILEAMEYEPITTKSRLVRRTALGEVTVRRACQQLLREGILTLVGGCDADSGCRGELVTYADHPLLSVLELAEHRMLWRLGTTQCKSVLAALRKRSGTHTPEDDLDCLMGQVESTLRRGSCHLPKELAPSAPVLLIPSPETPAEPSRVCPLPSDPHHLVALLRRTAEITPARVLTVSEAIAHELGYSPIARGCDSVLYIGCLDLTALLLVRKTLSAPQSPLIPAPFAERLSELLRHKAARHCRGDESRTEAVTAFLRDALRCMTPDCIVIEADAAAGSPEIPPSLLPPSTRLVHTVCALHTPSIAHLGALRMARKDLWSRMEKAAPESCPV